MNPAWPEHGLDGFTIFDSSAGLYIVAWIPQCSIIIVNPAWPEHGLDDFAFFDSSAGL